MTKMTDADWPVTWSQVEDEQLRAWVQATPAQRLAWLEEMLEFARLAGVLPSPG
jgi:hypothetical protein